MLRAAFIGVGGRARACARAYEQIDGATIVAACNRSGGNPLAEFQSEFGIDSCYTDVEQMLARERPDLVHIVTGPIERPGLMHTVSEYEVPVAIVEKPIAVQGEDWRDIAALAQRTRTRFVVNTQLHFHEANVRLREDVRSGAIGELRYLDGSARSTMLNQGVHILELMHSYAAWNDPVAIFAQASGVQSLAGSEPSPDTLTASLSFAGGLRAGLSTGYFAPKSNPAERIYHHKRIAAYGTHGFTHWTMTGWERSTRAGGYERGEHSYQDEDLKAQAELTRTALQLVADPQGVHPTRLELSVRQFNIILGAYVSALFHRPVDLPCEPPDRLLELLRTALDESNLYPQGRETRSTERT